MIDKLLYSPTQNAKLYTLYYFLLFSLRILSHIIQHHTINTRQLHLLQYDCVTDFSPDTKEHLNYFKSLRSLFPPLQLPWRAYSSSTIWLYFSSNFGLILTHLLNFGYSDLFYAIGISSFYSVSPFHHLP